MSAAILVIEDNADNMKLFRWTLEDAGYDFTGVETAEEGLAILKKNLYDLVVMDIALPGIDGMEATRLLRADPQFESLPIIAVTAHAIKEQSDAILESGVSTIVTKPIDEDHFLATIASFLPAEQK